MGHPDRGEPEGVGEHVVWERAAEIGQDRGRRARGAGDGPGGEAHPRAVGVEPRGGEHLLAARGRDLNAREAVAIKVAAQRRQDRGGVDAHHEAQLPARPGPRRDRVHGARRVAAGIGQDLEGRPAIDPLGGRQARLAPPWIESRAAGLLRHLDAGERTAHGRRDPWGHPLGDADLARGSRDGGQRMGELQARIGEEPAEIARMVPALARVDPQVDRVAAPGAEEDRRLV
jgi:hypothetical protein